MARKRPFANPFYFLLLVVGVAFLLTASSYGVMAFREVQGHSAAASRSGLMTFLDRHGALLMIVELAVLAVASVAAMATDNYWTGRAEDGRAAEATEAGQASTDNKQLTTDDQQQSPHESHQPRAD
jgi:hypothetical protein